MKVNLRIRQGKIYPADDEAKEILASFQDADYLQVELKKFDKRSLLQNRSQWLWLSMIADCLNDNNMYITDTIKSEVLWNKDSVKALIFDPIIKALYNKDSSTKLNKDEYNKIIDTITNIFANKGIVLPEFPNKEF